jgi:hypothetical protein
MNYLKVYCNLIRKAEQRGYTKKKAKELGIYVEGHHTFPISIFGKNERIVYLTAREHYIAHLLLEKIYIKRYGVGDEKTRKMTFVCIMMKNRDVKYNSHLYEQVRVRYIKNLKGNKRGIFLKIHDLEFKKTFIEVVKESTSRTEILEKLKIKPIKRHTYKILNDWIKELNLDISHLVKHTEKSKKKLKEMRLSAPKKTHTEEYKEKMRQNMWWNDGKNEKMSPSSPGEDWVKGRIIVPFGNTKKKSAYQKWICTETGFVTNAGSLTTYQKARGIDTSKRRRIS